ncbi:hypothetical protein LSH36_556g02006 [Paralvinella palmiformis]|uniref:DNA-directed RNA polymerase subunit n=1 Tax=Paralvinella palmiformis TaxID=53620 RepID=A0AAD9J6H7_9ANNE|nr:hypothetical protein LSH36_556g02006 [Paralvinella palmiformis]
MAEEKPFKSDIDFCPQCGTILPLPEAADVVLCQRCHYAIDAREFEGVEMVSKVVFNKRQVRTTGLSSDDFAGPTVDRRCPKCDNEGMTYATRQTRSADEGQTVFYTCSKCGFQEVEYS